jgi:hypothetical protein
MHEWTGSGRPVIQSTSALAANRRPPNEMHTHSCAVLQHNTAYSRDAKGGGSPTPQPRCCMTGCASFMQQQQQQQQQQQSPSLPRCPRIPGLEDHLQHRDFVPQRFETRAAPRNRSEELLARGAFVLTPWGRPAQGPLASSEIGPWARHTNLLPFRFAEHPNPRLHASIPSFDSLHPLLLHVRPTCACGDTGRPHGPSTPPGPAFLLSPPLFVTLVSTRPTRRCRVLSSSSGSEAALPTRPFDLNLLSPQLPQSFFRTRPFSRLPVGEPGSPTLSHSPTTTTTTTPPPPDGLRTLSLPTLYSATTEAP